MAEHPLIPGGVIFALLDTNALIPPRLSDVLFDLACKRLYFPRWTQKIEEEFIENWAEVIAGVARATRRTRKASNIAPMPEHVAGARNRLSKYRAAVGRNDWEVIGYDDKDVTDRVPKEVDAGDVHLAAACLVISDSLSEEAGSHRVLLISNNVKHLAAPALGRLGVEVFTPGDFIDLMCLAQPSLVEESLCKTVEDLNDYSKEKLLTDLSLHKANKTVALFENKWHIKIRTASAPSVGP